MKKWKRIQEFLYISAITAFSYLLMFTPVEAGNPEMQALQNGLSELWDKYWFYIAIFVAFGVLTGVLAFIVLFIRLGANSDKPEERRKIYKEMVAVAVCTALLGSITFVVTLYLSLFN